MGAPSLPSVLRTLGKERLWLLGRELGFTAAPDLSKEQQVAVWTKHVRSDLTVLLPRLTREELRTACRAHELDASDRAREPLMARLMGSRASELFRAPERPIGRDVASEVLPKRGQIAIVRHRQYLVEDVHPPKGPTEHTHVKLVCLDDDAPGRLLEVLWELELGAQIVEPDVEGLGKIETLDESRVFAAYLHALKWNCVTATDGKLFQAPFRAGIKIYSHQLVPLQTALALPRANLFIADDVGLGKTIEAGLIVQELLLRQRIRQVIIVAPASVCLQWRDEMERRFGQRFEIYNRKFVVRRQQERGFGVNPWSTFPRFIVSYQTLRRPEYQEPLLIHLGDRADRSLLVLDEAHTAAPASASKYAVDSKVTRIIRQLASRFEHRLFLSATPHNGHSNSFSALLEILDPQRFTRGVDVAPKDLEPVMVRRLKRDLKGMSSIELPDRKIHQIDLTHAGGHWHQSIDDAPATDLGQGSDAELTLARLLEQYGQSVTVRHKRGALVLVNLQKRLLSSVDAFWRTLQVHAQAQGGATTEAAEAFEDETEEGETEEVIEAEAADLVRRRSGAIVAESAEARRLLAE